MVKKTNKKHFKAILSKSEGIPSKEAKSSFKRLYFDIETSYNVVAAWNVGYDISLTPDTILKERAIICICWKWDGNDKVHSLEWNKGDDKQLLLDFMEVMNSATEIISHNGDQYDVKWIRARCLFHRIPMPPDYQSVDTLKVARTFRLNSKKLDYIGQFLGVGKKLKTGGFDLWKKICEEDDPIAMRLMIKYCKQDVRLLESVYKQLQPYSKHKTHRAVLAGGSRIDCPECMSIKTESQGTRTLSSGIIQRRMRCTDCGKYFTISNKVYLDIRELKD